MPVLRYWNGKSWEVISTGGGGGEPGPAGPQGPQGIQGIPGPPGADGKDGENVTVSSSTSPPTQPKPGDVWVDTNPDARKYPTLGEAVEYANLGDDPRFPSLKDQYPTLD